MDKGFGIAALVLAILSLFSPVFVNFLAIWAGMICAAAAILYGERGLSVAAAIIAFVGLLLFSPVSMGMVSLSLHNDSFRLSFMAFGSFAIPIIALIADICRQIEEERHGRAPSVGGKIESGGEPL